MQAHTRSRRFAWGTGLSGNLPASPEPTFHFAEAVGKRGTSYAIDLATAKLRTLNKPFFEDLSEISCFRVGELLCS